jgi:hypothetical protein
MDMSKLAFKLEAVAEKLQVLREPFSHEPFGLLIVEFPVRAISLPLRAEEVWKLRLDPDPARDAGDVLFQTFEARYEAAVGPERGTYWERKCGFASSSGISAAARTNLGKSMPTRRPYSCSSRRVSPWPPGASIWRQHETSRSYGFRTNAKIK